MFNGKGGKKFIKGVCAMQVTKFVCLNETVKRLTRKESVVLFKICSLPILPQSHISA